MYPRKLRLWVLGPDLEIDLNVQDVKETLEFDERKMSNEDLFEISEPKAFEPEEDLNSEAIPGSSTELSYKQLQEILKKGQEYVDFIKDLDPILERKCKVTKNIEESLRCYKEEALEKSKNMKKQSKMTNFFIKTGEFSKMWSDTSNDLN